MLTHVDVAVCPPALLADAKNLFAALERAFPVRFEAASADAVKAAGVAIVAGGDGVLLEHLPVSATCFFIVPWEGSRRTSKPQAAFSDDKTVNVYLRSRTFDEPAAQGAPALVPQAGDAVLARSGADPVWVRRPTPAGFHDLVSAPLEELQTDEVLRDHLFPRRLLRLLPLVQFLRDVTRRQQWKSPPLRANYVFDDPNLHSLTYGKIDYRLMVAHADKHNYHAVMATIPFDAWWTNPKAARVFREHADRLSLMVHGNNHVHHELEGPKTEGEALGLLAQSLKRIAKLEEAAGLTVSKVMVGPHGALNDVVVRSMLRLGFEGACGNLSCIWRFNAKRRLALGGWSPAEFVGGLPVLVRKGLYQDHEDIPLRAFLELPIILYGHHENAAHDMSLLAENAAMVNSLGDVQWIGFDRMMRSNFLTRLDGDRLYVRLHSRRIELSVPDGIREVVLECPEPSFASSDSETAVLGDTRIPLSPDDGFLRSAPAPLPSGQPTGTMEVRLEASDAIDYSLIPDPPTRAPVIARRLLAETRDRLSGYK